MQGSSFALDELLGAARCSLEGVQTDCWVGSALQGGGQESPQHWDGRGL